MNGGKIPWGRKWQPTPVLLPEKSYGQRSLAGYSPWGHKELDTTEKITHIEWPSGCPYFIQFKPEFCNKEFMI